MEFAAIMALALAVDAAFGWPDALYRRIGHPVTWIGALISALEARWNRGSERLRRLKGVLCVAVVVMTGALPALVVQWALSGGATGIVVGAVVAWPWIAARSLFDHVKAVADPLARGDLDEARARVAMIVGRDPNQLDQNGVARSAIESLAENASDGVVAPLFWGAVAGLPGLVAYKTVNTLDSMIGHRTDRYEHFGKAAARLDDVLNLIPARLTGLVFALVSARPRMAFSTMVRDARQHRSPNAGWPEAAMAGALGVRLSGPRIYGDRVADEPWLNAGAPDPDAGAIDEALGLYLRATALAGACLVALALV